MFKKSVLLSAIVFAFLSRGTSQAPNDDLIEITGSVTAFFELTLSNVSVSARNARTTTLTDSLGVFMIRTKPEDVLRFSAAGFRNNSRTVNRDTDTLHVNMVFLNGNRHRKAAVGYGHISEEELAFAVSHYQSRNNDYAKYRDLRTLFQAVIPGAVVGFDNGLRVYFRGSQHVLNRTVTDNTGAALYVVDGMIVDGVDHLNVSDIASITALKGPESAIYGTRGANGVVLISTVGARY